MKAANGKVAEAPAHPALATTEHGVPRARGDRGSLPKLCPGLAAHLTGEGHSGSATSSKEPANAPPHKHPDRRPDRRPRFRPARGLHAATRLGRDRALHARAAAGRRGSHAGDPSHGPRGAPRTASQGTRHSRRERSHHRRGRCRIDRQRASHELQRLARAILRRRRQHASPADTHQRCGHRRCAVVRLEPRPRADTHERRIDRRPRQEHRADSHQRRRRGRQSRRRSR